MKIACLLSVILLICGLAVAQNPDCRASWMPPDAPAFCPWNTEPSLPEARTYHSVVMSGRYLYVLGGYRFDSATSKIIYYNSVLRSTIGSDGRLSAWTPEAAFVNGRGGAGAAVVGQCLFVSGGSSSGTSVNYYSDIQSARIGTDGRLSSWTTSPNRLKTARSNHSLVALRTDRGYFLNVVAGVTQMGQDTVHLDTIEVASVRDDCSVGEWTFANFHLKGGRSSPQALAVRNNVVVIGGWGDLDLVDVFNDVQTAAPRSDGTPAPWNTALGRLTTGIYGHATVFAELATAPNTALLLSTGGQPGTGAYSNWISYAYVLPGASIPSAIGQWRIAPVGKLPTGRAGLGSAESGARLYVIGGNDGSGQYYRDVISARFDFGKP